MKITKRRTGITIKCNEAEFEMLDKLISATPPDAARRMLTGNVKAAYTRRSRLTNGDLLSVDHDISDRAFTGNPVPLSPAARRQRENA